MILDNLKTIIRSAQEWISKERMKYLAHTSKAVQMVSKTVFYALVVGALLYAGLVIGLKLSTPWFNTHKAVFEQIAENYLHVPMQIQSVRIEWDGAEPIIVLQKIDFFDAKEKQIIARLGALRLNVKLFNSLLKRKLELDKIEISGIHLAARYFPDGRLQFQGLWNGQKLSIDTRRDAEGHLSVILPNILKNGSETPTVDQAALKEFLKNIGNAPQLTILNVAVNFTDAQNRQWQIKLPRMHFRIRGKQYIFSGRLNVLKPYAMRANADLVFSGDITTLKKIDAVLYLHLGNVNLSHILQKPIKGYNVKNGLLNGRFWLFFRQGEITSIQTALHLKNLLLVPKNTKSNKSSIKNLKSVNIHHLFGSFLWKKIPQGWQIEGSNVFLQTAQFDWPENQFVFRWREQSHQPFDQTLWIKYVNLDDLATIIIDRHLASNIAPKLQQLNPRGELQNLYLRHQGEFENRDHYKVAADLKNLAWQSIDKIPAVQGLSGHLSFGPDQGKFQLKSKNLIMDFGKLFAQPLSADQMTGDINWQHGKEKNQWKIHADKINILNDDLAFHAQAKLTLEPKESPNVSLLGGFNIANPKVVKKYLPVGIMHPALKDWLRQAFSGEKPLSGTVILNGSLNNFPFDNHSGVFTVDSQVQDVNLSYEKGWPPINHINGHLVFSGRSMLCTATSAEILNIPLTNIEAEIPGMGENRLVVVNAKGEAKTELSDILNYLRQTPLKDKLTIDLKNIRAKNGKAALHLNLSIPVEKIHEVKAKGKLDLKNTDLQLIRWRTTLHNINGQLSFLNNQWESDGLQTDLWGFPIKVAVKTAQNKPGSDVTRINFQSAIDTNSLEKHFQIPLSAFISGKTNYQAEIDLLWKKPSSQNTMTIHSNLKGIEADLPAGLKKQADDNLPSQFIFSFGAKDNLQNSLLIKYGDRLTAALLFKKNKFWSAHIHFGKMFTKVLTNKGVSIDGYLKSLNWENLRAYFSRKFKTISSKESFTFSSKKLFKPKEKEEKQIGEDIKNWLNFINLQFGQLEINHYTFKQTQLKIKPEKTSWSVTINNKNMTGALSIPNEWPKGTLVGKFNRLILSKQTLAQDEHTDINPNDLPALLFDINYLQYQNITFGNVHIQTTPGKNLLQINQFNINSSGLSAKLTGYWKALMNGKTCRGEHCSSYQYQSHLEGEANTSQFDVLLQEWHIASSVVAKSGYAKINLNWAGPIYSPHLKNLQGHILLKLQNGAVINLSKETTAKLNMGAILNLLSIHHLLGMSLSDYSQKGYNFEKMHGDLFLKNGLITTNNLYFDGSVAQIDVKGKVNMVSQSLDLYLTVIPYLTSSLPVIATIAGGPAVGAVTFVVNKLLGKQVGKLTAYKYHVIGTFKHPKVIQQKR